MVITVEKESLRRKHRSCELRVREGAKTMRRVKTGCDFQVAAKHMTHLKTCPLRDPLITPQTLQPLVLASLFDIIARVPPLLSSALPICRRLFSLVSLASFMDPHAGRGAWGSRHQDHGCWSSWHHRDNLPRSPSFFPCPGWYFHIDHARQCKVSLALCVEGRGCGMLYKMCFQLLMNKRPTRMAMSSV